MNPLISICIPTYNRACLLEEALHSCIAQRYRPLEIVIGDDSQDDETRVAIERLAPIEGVTIRYEKHSPGLGQSGNVNDLFQRARGDRLVLLHDDDLFCVGGLDALDAGWNKFPGARCVYGKQLVISAKGTTLPVDTAALNKETFRNSENVGPQESGLAAGLLQQIPNNCFLVETGLARKVGYRSEYDVGHSVDADFGIRLGMSVKPREFVCLDDFISKYRLSDASILRSRSGNYGHHLFFRFVDGLETAPAEHAAKQVLLHKIGLGASLDAAMSGHRLLALRIMRSPYYDKPFLSRWTMIRILCIASPRIGSQLHRWLLSCNH